MAAAPSAADHLPRLAERCSTTNGSRTLYLSTMTPCGGGGRGGTADNDDNYQRSSRQGSQCDAHVCVKHRASSTGQCQHCSIIQALVYFGGNTRHQRLLQRVLMCFAVLRPLSSAQVWPLVSAHSSSIGQAAYHRYVMCYKVLPEVH